MPRSDWPKSRDGRLLGKRALETRERLLDALLKELETVSGWRQLALLEVARSAGTSPAAVYQHWDNAEDALFDLTRRQLEARVRLSARHLDVLESLAVWGWPGAKRLLAEVEAAADLEKETPEVPSA